MRIGIDARELCGHSTGAGRYLGGLLTAWAGDERTRRHHFVLYTQEPLTLRLDARRFPTRLVAGAPGVWWEQVRLPRVAAADHLDLFFAPAYTAPLALDVPTVVAIHDVSFVAHPEWFTTREGLRRRWLTRRAAQHARAVVTISEFSRGEIVERLGVPAGRIHVVPPGISPPGTSLARTEDPRVLFVGSIFNRRHVPDLIRAFADVARRYPAASLDIVGDNRSYPHEDLTRTIAAEQMTDRVRCRSFVPDAELTDLYARARAFAFLSEYEGLGLTPLEALAAGAPPVIADTPVARESCGDAAVYVPVGDVRAAAHALERALFDEPTRAQVLAAAPEALARYDWPRAGRDTLAVLESGGR
jgi:glycosyltransferase involved in cell wall biosynthesis